MVLVLSFFLAVWKIVYLKYCMIILKDVSYLENKCRLIK